MRHAQRYVPYIPIVLGILLSATVVGAFYLYRTLGVTRSDATARETELTQTLIDAQGIIASSTARVSELETLLAESKSLLEQAVEERDTLSEDLNDEKDRNDAFERQIKKIGSTVGTLDKLAKTDPELLMKYSKVYFLNEHYMPEKLSEIDTKYVYREGGDPEFIQTPVEPFLTDMLEDALDDGVKLWIVSAFRSFDEQRALKSAYSVTYGSGANTFSADQGYSEHQLGTTVDLTTENQGGGLTTAFEGTPAYTWLTENAYKYGFVLSYPKDNAYYIFEPWHWRFVGVKLARNLHEDEKSFYNMDQREIDKYLISIFD